MEVERILTDLVALDRVAAEQPGPPAWLLIAPDGEVKSAKGSFTVDAEGFAAMREAFAGHGVEVPVDYEHQTLGGEYASPTGRAPAAGWVKELRYTPGRGVEGLIEFTAEAVKAIRAKEYRYFSPVLLVRKSDRRAVELHSIAVTNKPAIPRMEALAAKNSNQESSMNGIDKLREALKARGAAVEGQGEEELIALAVTKLGETPHRLEAGATQGEEATIAASTRKALGLKEDASAEAVTVALSAKLKGAEGETTELVSLRAEVTALKAQQATRDAQQIIDEAIKANKIAATDEAAIKSLMALAAKNFDEFKDVVANVLKPAVDPGRTNPPKGPLPGSSASTEDELIANSVKLHGGDYRAGLIALQADLVRTQTNQGLTRKHAHEVLAVQYPKIFGAD